MNLIYSLYSSSYKFYALLSRKMFVNTNYMYMINSQMHYMLLRCVFLIKFFKQYSRKYCNDYRYVVHRELIPEQLLSLESDWSLYAFEFLVGCCFL